MGGAEGEGWEGHSVRGGKGRGEGWEGQRGEVGPSPPSHTHQQEGSCDEDRSPWQQLTSLPWRDGQKGRGGGRDREGGKGGGSGRGRGAN